MGKGESLTDMTGEVHGDGPDAGELGRRWSPMVEDIAVQFAVGFVTGVLVTVFWDRVGSRWSNATWIGVVLASLGVLSLVALRRYARGRAAVVVIAALLAGAAVAVAVLAWLDRPEDGCGRVPAAGAAEVLVVWEGAELADFCAVVGEHERDVRVTSVGPDIATEVEARLAGGDPPDVAITPQASLVRRYASRGELCPFPSTEAADDELVDLFPDAWNGLVTVPEGGSGPARIYGVPVKGAHKSLFWYRPGTLDGEVPEEWSWDDFTAWVSEMADDPSSGAPLAIAAGDRWPLTDWFESQLAGTASRLYDQLTARSDESDQPEPIDWDGSAGRDLAATLTAMAELWRTPGVFAGGPEGARDRSWQELPRQLYDGEAVLAFGPSFLAGPIGDDLPANFRLQPVNFPELAQGHPLVVGGDFAVVPRSDQGCPRNGPGFDVVEWLTGGDALALWGRRDPGFLTPNANSPYRLAGGRDPDESENVRVLLTALIRQPPGGRLHFDLSDDQFAGAGQGDPRALWTIFDEFFLDVTGGRVGVECAVDRVVARLEAEYERTREIPPC